MSATSQECFEGIFEEISGANADVDPWICRDLLNQFLVDEFMTFYLQKVKGQTHYDIITNILQYSIVSPDRRRDYRLGCIDFLCEASVF